MDLSYVLTCEFRGELFNNKTVFKIPNLLLCFHPLFDHLRTTLLNEPSLTQVWVNYFSYLHKLCFLHMHKVNVYFLKPLVLQPLFKGVNFQRHPSLLLFT